MKKSQAVKDQREEGVFDKFSKMPRSENIATSAAIKALLGILKKEKPKMVLELGGGIGTLSYLLLKHSGAYVDIYEDLSFCIEALRENLREFNSQYSIVTSYDDPTPHNHYDLIIVDGGTMEFYVRMIKDLTFKTIFIEGTREKTRRVLRRELSKKYIFRLKRYPGGFGIICYPSENILFRFLSFHFWETFEGTRLKIRNVFKRIFK